MDNKYINKIEGDSFVVDGNTSNITIYPGYKEYIKINNIIQPTLLEKKYFISRFYLVQT